MHSFRKSSDNVINKDNEESGREDRALGDSCLKAKELTEFSIERDSGPSVRKKGLYPSDKAKW